MTAAPLRPVSFSCFNVLLIHDTKDYECSFCRHVVDLSVLFSQIFLNCFSWGKTNTIISFGILLSDRAENSIFNQTGAKALQL